MNRALLYFLLVFSIFFGTSCGRKTMPPEKFAHVYVESLIIQEKYSSDRPKMKKGLDKLYAEAGIDSAVYKATLKYYSEDAEKWDLFFTETEKYLEKRKKTF